MSAVQRLSGGLGLIALAAFLCVGCSESPKLRFANVPHDWFNAPVLLAIEDWEGEGDRDIAAIALTSGLASKTTVSAGNADLGLASPVVLLLDANSGKSVQILGCYMSSSSVLGIVTRGEGADEPIGYVSGTISEVFLANYLKKQGRSEAYDAGAVRKVAYAPPNIVAALEGKLTDQPSVQSISIWEPHLSRAGRIEGTRILRDESVYTMHVCLIANRNSLASRSSTMLRFAQQVATSTQYIAKQPDEARRRIEISTGLGEQALAESWSRAEFRYVDSREELLQILRSEIAALESAGMLREIPDPSTLLGVAR